MQLYAAEDTAAVEAVLFQKCVNVAVGPLAIHACGDATGPSISVDVTLLGTSLGRCELSPQHHDCKLAGSIAGFKAEIDLTFGASPLHLVLEGQLCAPLAGCKSIGPQTIPL